MNGLRLPRQRVDPPRQRGGVPARVDQFSDERLRQDLSPEPARSTPSTILPPAESRRKRAFDLLALDLDGTSLRPDGTLSPEVIRAVLDANAAGVMVVIATARPPRSVRTFYDSLQLNTPQISYNGALIVHPPSGMELSHTPLAGTIARRAVALARHLDPETVIDLEINDRWITDRVDERFTTATAKQFGADEVGPLKPWLTQPVTKLMISQTPERLRPIHDALLARFRRRMDIHITDADRIQLVARGVDKAWAISDVARRFAISPERVMAVGDAPNDAAMLNWAGLGVVVRNAWPEARAAADAEVAANEHDGVAEAIDRFLLPRKRSPLK